MRVSLRKSSTCATYLLSDVPLNPITSFVDLGVHIDCRLSFSGHIFNFFLLLCIYLSYCLFCLIGE